MVAAFGGAILLQEWWQKTPFVDDVIVEVRRTKPVRIHFTFTQSVNTNVAITVMTALRPVIYARLNLTEA